MLVLGVYSQLYISSSTCSLLSNKGGIRSLQALFFRLSVSWKQMAWPMGGTVKKLNSKRRRKDSISFSPPSVPQVSSQALCFLHDISSPHTSPPWF